MMNAGKKDKIKREAVSNLKFLRRPLFFYPNGGSDGDDCIPGNVRGVGGNSDVLRNRT